MGILDLEDEISFGKYDGRSIEWIIENDIDYLRYLYREGIVVFSEDVEAYL